MLSRELARSERERTPVGVVIVDLDHFKNVNDSHGHLAGDAVLCEAARRMQGGVRQYDSIGRYGGEEFLILLPGCDEQSSFTQAERLRKQIAQAEMSLNGTTLRLTASFGVTCAVPGQPWTHEALIRKADEALYLAKKLGRNRVEFLSFDLRAGSDGQSESRSNPSCRSEDPALAYRFCATWKWLKVPA